MTVEVKWSRQDGISIASVFGRIDSGTAGDLRTLLEDGLSEDERALILDLEKASYISSAGLRVFLIIARRFTAPDKQFALCSLAAVPREVVALSGFDALIDVYRSRAQAIRALADG